MQFAPAGRPVLKQPTGEKPFAMRIEAPNLQFVAKRLCQQPLVKRCHQMMLATLKTLVPDHCRRRRQMNVAHACVIYCHLYISANGTWNKTRPTTLTHVCWRGAKTIGRI